MCRSTSRHFEIPLGTRPPCFWGRTSCQLALVNTLGQYGAVLGSNTSRCDSRPFVQDGKWNYKYSKWVLSENRVRMGTVPYPNISPNLMVNHHCSACYPLKYVAFAGDQSIPHFWTNPTSAKRIESARLRVMPTLRLCWYCR